MNDEAIFYLFTKAMDLKYDDTVEAIQDLVSFCVATENCDIWNEIYDFVRNKAQFIIDNNNVNDKKDCIEQFKNDDWLEKYINKVKELQKETLNINGALWINDVKYEYVNKIEITYDKVLIYLGSNRIGSIQRNHINTIYEQYVEKNHNAVNIEDILSFDIKKIGEF